MAEEATVKFNVGGKQFEASRALIDAHSDTMLGRLVSDTWNEDPGKAVFIDRDGDIFAHILNYLRYGSIELPITLPRSMFDRELDYYGITSMQGIEDQVSVGKIVKALNAKVVKAQKELTEAQMKQDMFLLALECNHQFWARKYHHPSIKSVDNVYIPTSHYLHNTRDVTNDPSNEERKLFDQYLEQHFGLMVAADKKVYRNSKGFTVCNSKN
ncbi:hypothetical protein ACHAXR_012195 [Thalassiosira sp. AJA248-18]